MTIVHMVGSQSAEQTRYRKLYRRRPGRLLGGVATGVAEHLGVPVWATRLVFVASALFHALGLMIYLILWVVLDTDPADSAPGSREMSWRNRVWRDGGTLALFTVAAVVLSSFLLLFNSPGRVFLIWSVLAVVCGAAVMWHLADARQRQLWQERVPELRRLALFTEPGRASWVFRVAVGGTLVLIGFIGVLAVAGELNAIRNGLLFSALTLGGVLIVAGPWLWQLIQQLRAERTERIRSQERAEIAALVHDKVLHTLALIQRSSSNPREVTRLARGQERELRHWLYKPAASPSERFVDAIEAIAAEVEDSYAVTVEVVIVGDSAMSERIDAMVAAAREALVNAAKHSQASSISLYAEVEAAQNITVFVRDRGTGFDINSIVGDRHGIRGSIVDRMRRHGGEAEIRSVTGSGTEVCLTMPVASS